VELDELVRIARQVVTAYSVKNKMAGRHDWTLENYLAGFVGDVGDLSKLVMAKSGYRDADNVDERIAHELSDCLWSILVIADELRLDLAAAYKSNMKTLLGQITQEQNEQRSGASAR
jgi:NTP pyrophosphatase (non-canonical NTP hydrolase)